MYKKFKENRRQKQGRKEEKLLLKHAAINMAIHFQHLATTSQQPGIQSRSEKPLIVSLTTYSSRINDVHLTIESIFQQSVKPDRVVLTLDSINFNEDNIPAILKQQRERGLEIIFCEEDLGPYKKFFYALQKYPDSILVTVDDDVMYPADLLDQLYRAHLEQPNVIHCHRAHKMKLDENNELKPYKSWDFGTGDYRASLNVFPTGVGGVLYFPGCFDDDIFNKDTFMKLAPGADDVWLKAMSLKKGTPCKRVEDKRNWGLRFIVILGSQVVKLKAQNKKAGGNDAKIKAVFGHYDLTKKLL